MISYFLEVLLQKFQEKLSGTYVEGESTAAIYVSFELFRPLFSFCSFLFTQAAFFGLESYLVNF